MDREAKQNETEAAKRRRDWPQLRAGQVKWSVVAWRKQKLHVEQSELPSVCMCVCEPFWPLPAYAIWNLHTTKLRSLDRS